MPRGGQNKTSREDIVRDITGLARVLGDAPTQTEYIEVGKFSKTPVVSEFGSWSAAKDELDLDVYHRPDSAVTVACANCGVDVEKQPSEVENSEYSYCSQDCVNEHKRDRYSGDGNPRSTLEEVECETCGETLQRPKWMRESRDRHFCDYECMGEWKSDEQTGEGNVRWSEFETYECEYCGQSYKIKPSEADRTRFCSRPCRDAGIDLSGERNHKWKQYPTNQCENCGDGYKVKPAEADKSRFCSYDCMHEVAHPAGEDHPRWNPNREKLYYGANWAEQRQRAVIRDQARCQNPDCSMPEPENIQRSGKGLDVHHKTPLREFKQSGEIDYSEANALQNLITLCRNCHRRVESDSHDLSV